MLKTLLTGAAVSSVPMENGQWIPEHLHGRYRSFNVKMGLAQTMGAGEWGFTLDNDSITAYKQDGSVLAKSQATYKDGALLISKGLETHAVYLEHLSEVNPSTTQVFGLYEDIIMGTEVPTMSQAMRTVNSNVSIAWKCKEGANCDFEGLSAESQVGTENSEAVEWDLAHKSFIYREMIIDQDHAKMAEIDVKAFVDGHFYERVANGPVMTGKAWITGMNDDGEFTQVSQVDGNVVYQACKHHLTNDNIWALIECGSSPNQMTNSIAKAHEDPKGFVTLGISCVSEYCDFSSVDPVPMNMASLLMSQL